MVEGESRKSVDVGCRVGVRFRVSSLARLFCPTRHHNLSVKQFPARPRAERRVMSKLKFKNRLLVAAISAIAVLNVTLASFLLRTAFTQSIDDTKNQKSVVSQVRNQERSPMFISIRDIDNTNKDFQVVNFTVQNISSAPIRGYVIVGEPHGGKILTNFFPITPFLPGVVYAQEIVLERKNIQKEEVLSLSVDYVVFTDGKTWGANHTRKSEHFEGAFAGVAAAVDAVKDMINKNQSNQLDELRSTRLLDIEVRLPNVKENSGEKWENGFREGYKSVISFIKGQPDTAILAGKLDEIKKNLRIERGGTR